MWYGTVMVFNLHIVMYTCFIVHNYIEELVPQYGVYMSFIDVDSKEQGSKGTATGLMRSLISIWYPPLWLAASSASKGIGINPRIRAAVFSKCNDGMH